MRVLLINFSIILCFLFQTNVSGKAVDFFIFNSTVEESRFHNLLGELRCLVCQNQNLADSNAPLAQDLKMQVYQQVQKGLSDEEIKRYLVKRYGEYILFKPIVNRITFLLWLGPFAFLCGAIIILYVSVRRQGINNSIHVFQEESKESNLV